MRLIFRVLIAAALTMVAAPRAFAISAESPSKTCKVLFANSITIHGVVRDVTSDVDTVNDPEGIDGWRYEIGVLKVYRGTTTGNRIIVKSANTAKRPTADMACPTTALLWLLGSARRSSCNACRSGLPDE